MSPRVTVAAFLFAFLPAGCQSQKPLRPDAQAIVEKLASENNDVVRLTVHMMPPAGGAVCAVASTSVDRLNKPSDAEDLQAMQTGKTVVLDEAGSVDVTVPILQRYGQWMGAVGVTLRGASGQTREQTAAKATAIARAVEKEMAKGS